MNWLSWCWSLFKMFYEILYCLVIVIILLLEAFWLVCYLTSAALPWIIVALLGICVASKFVKLRGPHEKQILQLLGAALDDLAYWPIAHRAASYDSPANSKAAIKMCVSRGYHNVLLDASLTACGEIVITSEELLGRVGLYNWVYKYTLSELRTICITELHPMGSHCEPESIYTINELAQFLEETKIRLTLFLHIHDNSKLMLEKLLDFLQKHEEFSKRTIIISRSPIALYKLRKLQPDLMCGLWQKKKHSLGMLTASPLFKSIYGIVFRNIITPVIGISVVFINKEEFNLHIAELWRNVGVRPIAYNVNSPNEKRYFQQTMNTQYLTDSLRSEPHQLMKA